MKKRSAPSSAAARKVTTRTRKPRPVQTVALVSLGCPKNLVDSEKMLGLLAEAGLTPVQDHQQADAIVINTCGFLEAAKLESVEEINQAAEFKKAGSCQRLIVAGCLVQRHRAKLLEWCPDIDALIGVFDRDRIVQAVCGDRTARSSQQSTLPLPVYSSIAGNAVVAKKERELGRSAAGYFESDSARLRLTPRHYAYLRISEGCNQNCAFCTIPSIRGKMRSKPIDALLLEAAELLSDGAFELNLIGQDTTSYGQDIGYDAPDQGLVGMLTALDRLAIQHGGAWLRLMYAYPSCFSDAMIDAIARLGNVLKYIDMPLQHIDDQVLDHMRRRTSRKLIEQLLSKLRKRVPGIAIRTTFISGFPGETDAQHRELVRFVKDADFEAMGVFPYSPEPGTPAGTMHQKGQAVPESVIQQRIEELMLIQQQRVFDRNQRRAQAGEELDVLIDGLAGQGAIHSSINREEPASTSPLPWTDQREAPQRKPMRGGKLYRGRSYQQAPQIDSLTLVAARHKLTAGEIVRCRIVDSDGYDLIAQPVAELDKTVSLPLAR